MRSSTPEEYTSAPGAAGPHSKAPWNAFLTSRCVDSRSHRLQFSCSILLSGCLYLIPAPIALAYREVQWSCRAISRVMEALGRFAGFCSGLSGLLAAGSAANPLYLRDRRVESRRCSKPEPYIRKGDGACHL